MKALLMPAFAVFLTISCNDAESSSKIRVRPKAQDVGALKNELPEPKNVKVTFAEKEIGKYVNKKVVIVEEMTFEFEIYHNLDYPKSATYRSTSFPRTYLVISEFVDEYVIKKIFSDEVNENIKENFQKLIFGENDKVTHKCYRDDDQIARLLHTEPENVIELSYRSISSLNHGMQFEVTGEYLQIKANKSAVQSIFRTKSFTGAEGQFVMNYPCEEVEI